MVPVNVSGPPCMKMTPLPLMTPPYVYAMGRLKVSAPAVATLMSPVIEPVVP